MNFSQKVALVTGGASGIGLSSAKALLQNRVKAVVIADVNVELGFQAVEVIQKEFGANKALFVKTDVSDKLQFDDAFKKTVEVFGNVDILINNAGICNDKEWEREIAINLQGSINGVLLGFDKFLNKGADEGIIVNIASVGVFSPIESFPIYTATKHGIIGLTQVFGSENHYKRSNVRILALCPGATRTQLTNIMPKDVVLGPEYMSLMPTPKEFQSSEAVANALIYAIIHGKTGSLWVVEEGEYYEVYTQKIESIKYK